MEGLPWVNVVCDGTKVDQPCINECQKRHGSHATAWCRSLLPFAPEQVCYCIWC
ncbi:hypothetical protein PHJA_001375900 [Phtheirospermum japonicum]|uniref:Uncharacterized protein n=1 Tax=Phtheirospermum japonicum TaxID=374723 RepID=A0A830C5E0_9LAMI|nr:hypothetical protein PHJA_001375900 [Phtheirospermum japonicum]